VSLSYYNNQMIVTMPKLEVCKVSKETVGRVKDFYNASLSIKFSALNTLNFTVPATIYSSDHKEIVNPLLEVLRDRYLIRLTLNGEEEYFVIMKSTKTMEQDGFESVSYQCYSLGVQIASSLIRDYKEESLNLSAHVRNFLSETNWKIDYVDADFDLKYRSYEMSSGNALQCIFDICEKFNATVVFNTLKRTVNFHHPKNVGKNRGLRTKKGKYLESFNLDIDAEAMVTRLVAYGADGVDFRRLSPTGSNYLEDYSFYMYPFQHDGNYNVIKKSKYMSDSLCIAILKYQSKLELLQGQFDSLVAQATTKRAEIQSAEQQLSVYENEERDLLNQRDVINYTYKDNAPNQLEWQNVIAKLTATQENIRRQNATIASLSAELETINNSINNLREQVKTENNFTSEQIKEWKDYQHAKEYYNDSITSDEDLLKESKEVFAEFRQPPVSLNMSIEDFTKDIDFNLDRDKLNIGDILTLTSKDLNINVTAKMTEITMNFDAQTVAITVANTDAYSDDYAKFIESLSLATNTSTTVQRDKWNWDKGREAYDDVSELLENAFDAAKQLITGGLNNSVTLSERGLVSMDMQEKSTWLMITNGQLLITPDNGNSVSVAISKNGVHAERLVGRLILGNKLWIEDEQGIVSIQSGTVTIYDNNARVRAQLGKYQDPENQHNMKYGLRIYDGAFDIRTNEGLRGVQLDENGIRAYNSNGVRTFEVVAGTGEVKIIGSLSIKTNQDSNRGVTLDSSGIRGYDNSGNKNFDLDTNGNLYVSGTIEYSRGNNNNLGGSFNGEFNGLVTGTLDAVDGTFTGHLQAATMDVQTMRTIELDADQITTGGLTANRIDVNELSAISSKLGDIESGNIDIAEDLSVGKIIRLGKKWGDVQTSIVFGGTSQISADWTQMNISAISLTLQADRLNLGHSGSIVQCFGDWDFSQARVNGLR